jgi:hypothetical protein
VVEKGKYDEERDSLVLEFEPGDETAEDLWKIREHLRGAVYYILDLYETIISIGIDRSIDDPDTSFMLHTIGKIEDELRNIRIIINKMSKKMVMQVDKKTLTSNHNH